MKVLVLEDDPMVSRGVVRVVKGMGHEVIAVDALPAALSALEQNPDVDVILADVGLPDGQTGLDLLRMAQSTGHRARRILISGAVEEPPDAGSGLVQQFVSKPLGRAELMQLVAGA